MSRPYAEVIGDPIAQSKSPLIHGHWLRLLGIEAEYRRALVPAAGLAAYVAAARDDPDWRGCNVTMPHKLAITALVDDPDGVGEGIGAMNAVVRRGDGRLVGANTDAAGFWSPIADCDLAGQPVTVVGAGGAARAVLWALARAGVGEVTLLNRTPARGAELLAAFALKGRARALDTAVPPSALLVNASALGMRGQPRFAPDLSALPAGATVYDLVYAPLETPLLQAARARGFRTVNGLEMLVGQAAVAFQLFFGQAPPRDHDAELMQRLAA